MSEATRKEKVCQEEQCAEQWSALSPDLRAQCATFVYCPFCANEMVTRCSSCGEAIHDAGFQVCPWCGAGFQE